MSTLELENIKHPDNSGDNIALASNGSITIDRQSTDGTIAEFRKDGTAVGSIGATSGNSYIVNSTNGGIRLGNEYGRAVLEPCNESRTPEDNLHFIGSSTIRWRDLYLSGGVYLGGTGAANKLDDYEEGTWTPDISWVGVNAETYSRQVGSYIKIGQLVYCSIAIIFDKNTSTGNFGLGGFPFTNNASSSNDRGTGNFGYFAGLTDGSTTPLFLMENNQTFGYFRLSGGSASNNGTLVMTNSNIGGTVNFHMDVTYRTTQ